VTGATPTGVIGQSALSGTAPNGLSADGRTSAEGLVSPVGLFLDRQNTLYVTDTGNNRVLHFLRRAAVVNAATFQANAPVTSGGLVTLFGAGIAETLETASSVPWPSSLAGRMVIVEDDTRAPVLMMSPGQANFQMPSGVPSGFARVAIAAADTGELMAGDTVPVAASSPGLFTASQDGRGQALALNQDNTLNGPGNPAARRSVISLFGTGQGQVNPPVPDGVAAPSDQLSNTTATPTSDGRTCLTVQPSMCVAIGTTFGEVLFSGLAPGFIGLWQINVRIPDTLTPGNAVPLRVVINAAASNTVNISVR
jgi:uncharacterized protein (TIGR03437 family)